MICWRGEGLNSAQWKIGIHVSGPKNFLIKKDKALEDGITRKNDQDDQVTHASMEIIVNGKIHTGNASLSLRNLDIEISSMEQDGGKYTLTRDGSFSPECYDYPNTDAASEFSMADTIWSLHRNRVQVYPRKPNMVFFFLESETVLMRSVTRVGLEPPTYGLRVREVDHSANLSAQPNMVLPEGASIIPVGDDKFVAVSFDLSNRGCK